MFKLDLYFLRRGPYLIDCKIVHSTSKLDILNIMVCEPIGLNGHNFFILEYDSKIKGVVEMLFECFSEFHKKRGPAYGDRPPQFNE